MTSIGIFIFHNDLRLYDNYGLRKMAKYCDVIVPVFIFTPQQISVANKYRSLAAIQFMLAALEFLEASIRQMKGRLYYFYGDTSTIVRQLIKELNPSIICSNANYTPFALKRDEEIYDICENRKCEFLLVEDYCLYDIGTILNGSGKIYKKFTPFYNAAVKVKPNQILKGGNFRFLMPRLRTNIELKSMYSKFRLKPLKLTNPALMLKSLSRFGNYNAQRNNLNYETSYLSAYIKFGLVSVRQVYWILAEHRNKEMIKQLYWREFFINLAWDNPYVYGANFNRSYKAKWYTVPKHPYLIAWTQGKTGFPIVDACMTQLNSTGYMHNRGRLIVAGFLTKVLGWHWRFGEMYFATKLRDYDPAINNGNWQFVAGSGVDQQPYFRMFNPWLQSKAHDPKGEYIKHWCPVYKDVDPKILHNEAKLIAYAKTNKKIIKPIVNYAKQAKIIKSKIYH